MTREEAPTLSLEEAYASNLKRAHEALVLAKACLYAAAEQHRDGHDERAYALAETLYDVIAEVADVRFPAPRARA